MLTCPELWHSPACRCCAASCGKRGYRACTEVLSTRRPYSCAYSHRRPGSCYSETILVHQNMQAGDYFCCPCPATIFWGGGRVPIAQPLITIQRAHLVGWEQVPTVAACRSSRKWGPVDAGVSRVPQHAAAAADPPPLFSFVRLNCGCTEGVGFSLQWSQNWCI